MAAAASSSRVFDWTVAVIFSLAVGAGVTYVELTRHLPLPSWQAGPHVQKSATQANPVPKAAAAAPAQPTQAITTTYVHLRADKSTTSQILINLQAGTTVQLHDGGDATWQAVSYQGRSGFIYHSYLQTR